MTVAEALRIAAKRVRVNHFGPHQYQVQTWEPDHNAWYMHNICNRSSALHIAWEAKVQIALYLLEIGDVTECGALANSACYNVYPRDWRQVVREEVAADKFAQEQQEMVR